MDAFSYSCKKNHLISQPYGTHIMTRAQFKEMETLIGARLDALETQIRQGREELGSKIEKVRLTLEEVKGLVEQPGKDGISSRASFMNNSQLLHVAEIDLNAIASVVFGAGVENQISGQGEMKREAVEV